MKVSRNSRRLRSPWWSSERITPPPKRLRKRGQLYNLWVCIGWLLQQSLHSVQLLRSLTLQFLACDLHSCLPQGILHDAWQFVAISRTVAVRRFNEKCSPEFALGVTIPMEAGSVTLWLLLLLTVVSSLRTKDCSQKQCRPVISRIGCLHTGVWHIGLIYYCFIYVLECNAVTVKGGCIPKNVRNY
jgi:hypothetical protein